MRTTSACYGAQFGQDTQFQGIYSYVSGGDDPVEEQDRQADLLWSAFQVEVDERLPERVWWQPATSEFIYDVQVADTVPEQEEMEELFAAAWQAVEARYDEIVGAGRP